MSHGALLAIGPLELVLHRALICDIEATQAMSILLGWKSRASVIQAMTKKAINQMAPFYFVFGVFFQSLGQRKITTNPYWLRVELFFF